MKQTVHETNMPFKYKKTLQKVNWLVLYVNQIFDFIKFNSQKKKQKNLQISFEQQIVFITMELRSIA